MDLHDIPKRPALELDPPDALDGDLRKAAETMIVALEMAVQMLNRCSCQPMQPLRTAIARASDLYTPTLPEGHQRE